MQPGAILAKIENEEIVVVDNGKRKSRKKAKVHFEQMFRKQLKAI